MPALSMKAIKVGNSEEDSALPEYSYYEVDAVELTRTFNRDKTTTIVLPFDIDMDYVWGGIFCKFNGVKKKGNNSVVSLMFEKHFPSSSPQAKK